MNLIALIGGGFATFLVGRKLLTLSSLSNNIIIEVSPRIHQVKVIPPTLIVAADTKIKNPSRGTVTVKQPTVSIFDSQESVNANTPLVSSQVVNKDYVIPKSGELRIDPIMLEIPVLKAAGLVSKLFSQGNLKLFVRKGTIINNLIPFSSVDEQTIKI